MSKSRTTMELVAALERELVDALVHVDEIGAGDETSTGCLIEALRLLGCIRADVEDLERRCARLEASPTATSSP